LNTRFKDIGIGVVAEAPSRDAGATYTTNFGRH
jgi:uncharacterized protein YkwD